MNTRTSLLIAYLASSGLVSGNIFAQENTTQATPDAFPEEYVEVVEDTTPIVPEAFISKPAYSDIELGIGYVTDDAYFFGRYNGLQTEGAYLVGDIDAEKFSDDGRFWRIRGTNLGLESRYLRLEGGKQGSHKFFLEWDELPNYKNNTAVTPFTGVGTDNLTLPSGFDLGPPVSSLNPFELQTKRERIKAGAGFVAKQRWLFDIDFSHENKQGIDAVGGAIATGTTQLVQRTNTSLLPEPIDQDTDLVNATLTYAGDKGQVDLAYNASFFNNTYTSLNWQDPFNPTTGAGSMALAPDNEFHQLSLTGAYTLPYKSRLTGVASMGRMTQNQKFQPYSINSSIDTLPSTSLDGEVWVLNGQLKLSSRPLTKLRLNAELRYDERDNQTPVQTYSYVILDSGGAGGAVENNPYSYKNNRFNLDANYRFNAIVSLLGGYKYNAMERSKFNAGREDTDENTLFAKFKIKPHSTVDLELYGEANSRDGSEFDQPGYQDPLMRKYNLADRDRSKAGALINYMATEKLYLGARADYSKDDYTETQIGLTEASQPTVTIDFSYTPVSNLTTYGYYTWENIQSSQNGNDITSGTGPGSAIPTPGPWQADFDDTFNTTGVGAKWTDLGKWDLGADLLYSKAVGHIEMNHQDPTIVEDQFPDNLTEMVSIKLWTDYNYSKRLVYKLGYWYEEYLADNWAVDNLEPYDPTVVARTLLLGNKTMDYEVRVFTVSASYRFQ
jgi:MtrB/PioB family decaheme-associated outer membrane protein